MGTTGKFPDGSEGGTLSASIYDGCLEEGEESLMSGISRVVIAFALFVAMGLVNSVYAGRAHIGVSGTFSPVLAPAGGTVTLSGQAKPNSSMSGYFSCGSGCGQTHLGVATANAQGQYSLTFKIPAGAKPGSAFVDIGCDNCGNNWRRVTGLQVQAPYRVPDFRPVPPQPRPVPTPPPVTQNPQPGTAPNQPLGDTLSNGILMPGQKITATSGLYHAVYQGDGNFVIYSGADPRNWKALWNTATDNQKSDFIAMQPDGNLVIYKGTPGRPGIQPVWATYSFGSNARLVMQNDGNLVIYSGSKPIWDSARLQSTPPSSLAPTPRPERATCTPSQVKPKAASSKEERCFGALGNACADQFKDGILGRAGIPAAVVGNDCSVTVAVSVGSILHDNCCRSVNDVGGDGLVCDGNSGDIGWSAIDTRHDKRNCAKEWRKAVYDVKEGRYWHEKFGPYLDDNAHDDLRQAPTQNARKTKLPGRLGVLDDVTESQGVERVETRRLHAPSGTKLEVHDVQFCASGRFKDEGWCGGTLCSSLGEINAARQAVRDWENWRNKKLAEVEEDIKKNHNWSGDPVAAALRFKVANEIALAEFDHASKVANVLRLEGIYNTRHTHWGICQYQ